MQTLACGVGCKGYGLKKGLAFSNRRKLVYFLFFSNVTQQEQRNRRANNRRRVKFAENKLDAVGLGNFEVKPIDVHEPSL